MTIQPKPWVIYSRVSTAEQAEEGASLAAQAEACRGYAKVRGWHVGEEIVDGGFTGTNTKRPGFRRLLEMMRRKEIAGVIAWKQKRISRNVQDTIDLIKLSDKMDVEIALVAEHIDTTTPVGRAMAMNMAIFAQLESEENGVQTSAAMRYLQRQGFYVGGPVPAGCRVVVDGPRRRLVAADSAETVRACWSQVIAGASLRDVAKHLRAAGIEPASRIKTDPKGWTPAMARRLLLSRQVVPVLIDASTQALVREKLASRKTPFRQGGSPMICKAVTKSFLAGILRCELCARACVQTVAYGRHGGAYRYFRCTGKNKGICKAKDTRCDLMEQRALILLAEAVKPDGLYAAHIRTVMTQAAEGLDGARSEMATLTTRQAALKARMRELALHESISTPGFAGVVAIIREEAQSVATAIGRLEGVIAAGETSAESAAAIIAEMSEGPIDGESYPTMVRTCQPTEGGGMKLELYLSKQGSGSYRTANWLPARDGVRTVIIEVLAAITGH